MTPRCRVAISVAACALWGPVQPARPQDADRARVTDGQIWNEMSPQTKAVYLIGYYEGVGFVCVSTVVRSTDATERRREGNEYSKLYSRFYPLGPATTGTQVVEWLDAFYGKPENVQVGISWAIQLMAAQVAGVGPAEMERRTEALRAAAK
jgi:hypothetical protein